MAMTFIHCNVLFPGGHFFTLDNVEDAISLMSQDVGLSIINAKLKVMIDNNECDFWFSSKDDLFEYLTDKVYF